MNTRFKRQTYTDGIRVDEIAPAYELKWPRYQYEVMVAPTGAMIAVSKKLAASGSCWPEGGVFVPTGWAESGMMPVPQEWYQPGDVGGEILADAQRTATADAGGFLRFANKWGALGVGVPGRDGFRSDEDFLFDSVSATGQWIAAVASWVEALRALQSGKKTSLTWDGLATILSGMLVGIHPAVSVARGRLSPIFKMSRLRDVLCLQIWEMATEGKRLRRCPECQALFIPGRKNQFFCTHLCANRPTVRRAKKKQRHAQSK